MRPRKLLRIARWEVTKGIGTVDRGVVAVAGAALALLLAVGIAGMVGGVALEDGIYRVGVAEDSEFHDPIAEDPTFVAVDPSPDAIENGRLVAGDQYDLLFRETPRQTRIYLAYSNGEPTEKSRAALAALEQSVGQYNDRRMLQEENSTAAFPVTVTIRYVEQGGSQTVALDRNTGGDDRTESSGDAGGASSPDEADSDESTQSGDSDESGVGTGETEGRIGAPSLGAFDLFGTAGTSGRPSDIQPPFPFQSLVLAFLFVLPLNFLIQAYGSSMLSERLDRRGELLLVAPIDRSDIVLGKTLPYFLASLLVTIAIVFGLWLLDGQAGVLSILAVLPLTLLFLSTTFLGAMFARSFKELTFVTVTISTTLTTYAFVPAIFAETSPVAFVSPLTLAIKDLTGTAVTLGQVAFATGPPSLVAGICFLLGFGVYREEDLFTQRPIHLKLLDALAGRIHRKRSLVIVVALLVPFVFVAELLVVALLFALPITLSIPLIFGAIAVIEELAKGLPIYAGFVHARYQRSLSVAVAVGAAAGVGFFLAEKLSLAIQLVGLPGSAVADAAFQTGLGTGNPAIVAVLALAPLALHSVTATLTAMGATRGRSMFVVGLLSAILVHLAYNVAVVSQFV